MQNLYNRTIINPLPNNYNQEIGYKTNCYFPEEKRYQNLMHITYRPKGNTLRRRFIANPAPSQEGNKYIISWWGQVWEPGKTLPERIIWIIIIIAVTTIWLYQVIEHMIEYIHATPLSRVDYVKNDTLELPSIVLCPMPIYLQPRISDLMKTHFPSYDSKNISTLLSLPSIQTVENLWNISRIDFPKAVDCIISEGIDIYHEEMNKTKCNVKEIKTTSGTCFLVKNENLLQYWGTHTNLHLTINTSQQIHNENYQLFLLHLDDLPLARYISAIHGYLFDYNFTSRIYLRFQELIYLNRRNSPCISGIKTSECLEKCLENDIYSKSRSNCRLPFMDNHNKRICSTVEEFGDVFNATNEVVNRFIPAKCNCTRQCLHVFYKTDYVSTQSADEFLNLFISFSYNSILLIAEYTRNNNFIELLSDIGGTMGLFLGICILNLIEILEGVCRFIWRICKPKRKT